MYTHKKKDDKRKAAVPKQSSFVREKASLNKSTQIATKCFKKM